MKGTLTRVYAIYPLAIPFAIWAVSQLGEIMARVFPGFVMFAADTGQWTVSFSSAEIVGGVLAGLAMIWGVFKRWGIKR
jgi:hypothetical protein